VTHRSGSAERGAAVSEFALLAGLVSILMLAAMQLAFVLHVHNTATAHVVEGARYGARADSSPEAGARRASDLLRESLPGAGGVSVTGGRAHVGGVQVVEVTAQVRLPVLGPFGPGEAMTVRAHAYAEDQ
jgi:Flp pilus assembly pilin Flp